MNKNKILSSIIIIITIYPLCGCTEVNNQDEKIKRFVGTWTEIQTESAKPATVTFYDDGTFIGDYWPLGDTWVINEETVEFSYSKDTQDAYAIYKYEFHGNESILKLSTVNTNISYIFSKIE